MRRILKSASEGLLSDILASDWRLRSIGHPLLVLAYHNIVPDDSVRIGDASLHLRLSAFQRQIDLIQQHFSVVSLASLAGADTIPEGPAVAITFDDAYSGALQFGVPVLNVRSLPATIFVAPGLLDGIYPWWDVLSSTSGLDANFRDQALWDLQGQQERIQDKARAMGIRFNRLPSTHRGASHELLDEAVSSTSISIGAHSWSHANLAALPINSLRRELHEPASYLSKRYPKAYIPALAYPYGLLSASADEEARQSGYRLTFAVSGGWCKGGCQTLSMPLPRFNVPADLSIRGFRLRLAGWLES